MKTHPVADLFPLMNDLELDALAADIKANGLQQPIVVTASSEVLDGRNRMLACERAAVKPETVTAPEGVDALALVVSLNVKRRNLTAGQRAIAAAEAWNQVSNLTPGEKTRDRLAEMFGVSTGYVQQARALVQYAPAAAEAVKRGEADLHGSYELYREERARLEAIQEEQQQLRARLEEITRTTAELDLLAPPAESELLPVDHETVKQSVAQSMPKTDLAEPSVEIIAWDTALAGASRAGAAIRQLPAYPDDADELLTITVQSVARALGDASARLLAALPQTEAQALRRIK